MFANFIRIVKSFFVLVEKSLIEVYGVVRDCLLFFWLLRTHAKREAPVGRMKYVFYYRFARFVILGGYYKYVCFF